MTSFFGEGVKPDKHEDGINWLVQGKEIWEKYREDNKAKLDELKSKIKEKKDSIEVDDFSDVVVDKENNNSLSSILLEHGKLRELKLLLVLVHLQVDKNISIDLIKIGDKVSVSKSSDGNYDLIIKRKDKIILNEKLLPESLLSSTSHVSAAPEVKTFESYAKKYEDEITALNKDSSSINPKIMDYDVKTGDELFTVLKDKFEINDNAKVFFILLWWKKLGVNIHQLNPGDKINISKDGDKYKFSIIQKGDKKTGDLVGNLDLGEIFDDVTVVAVDGTVLSSTTSTDKTLETNAKKYKTEITALNKKPDSIKPAIAEHTVITGDRLFTLLGDPFGITKDAEKFFILLSLNHQGIDINALSVGDVVKISKEGDKYKFSITKRGITTKVDLFAKLNLTTVFDSIAATPTASPSTLPTFSKTEVTTAYATYNSSKTTDDFIKFVELSETKYDSLNSDDHKRIILLTTAGLTNYLKSKDVKYKGAEITEANLRDIKKFNEIYKSIVKPTPKLNLTEKNKEYITALKNLFIFVRDKKLSVPVAPPPAPVSPLAAALLSSEEKNMLSKLGIDKNKKTDVEELEINISDSDVRNNSRALDFLTKFTNLKTLKISGLVSGLSSLQASHMIWNTPAYIENLEFTDATYTAGSKKVTTNFKSMYLEKFFKKNRPKLKTISFPKLSYFDEHSAEELPNGITLNLPKAEKLVDIKGITEKKYFNDEALKLFKEKNIKLTLPSSTDVNKNISSNQYSAIQHSVTKEYKIFDKEFINSITPQDINARVLTVSELNKNYIDEFSKFQNLNKITIKKVKDKTKTVLTELAKFPKHIKKLEFPEVTKIPSVYNGKWLKKLHPWLIDPGKNNSLEYILDKELSFPKVKEIDDSLAKDLCGTKTEVTFGATLSIKQKDLKAESVTYAYDKNLKRVILKENTFNGGKFVSTVNTNKDAMFNKLAKNEGTNEKDKLAFWSPKESFPSLGIGHFTWRTDDKFDYVFPQFVDFLLEKAEETPPSFTFPTKYQKTLYDKLMINGKLTFPKEWKNRASFDASLITTELRNFLDEKEVKAMQREFIMERTYKSLYSIIETETNSAVKTKLKTRINALIDKGDKCVFALLDYTNFKGNGLNTKERVGGNGWGLKQVILEMNEPIDLNSFVKSAKERLLVRTTVATGGTYHVTSGQYAGFVSRLNNYK